LTNSQSCAIINYKPKQRKEKKKMMYQIIITTENRTYRENWYNLIEASNRLLEVMDCQNVGMVDLMCLTTGEILVTAIDAVIEYVATEYIERFYEEI
jgi:hypothetical protein